MTLNSLTVCVSWLLPGMMALCLMLPPYRSKTLLNSVHTLKLWLWLLVMESVIVFWSSEGNAGNSSYSHQGHDLVHEEPIKLHTSPPSTTHLKAYIAGRNAWLSGTQSQPQKGMKFPNHLLVTPTLMSTVPHQFHMDFVDLGGGQLR